MGFWHIGMWEARPERAQEGLQQQIENDRHWSEDNCYTIEKEFGKTTRVWWYRWRRLRQVRTRTRKLPTT
jgi:hypothetical protein